MNEINNKRASPKTNVMKYGLLIIWCHLLKEIFAKDGAKCQNIPERKV
jgi:hypothetical protein